MIAAMPICANPRSMCTYPASASSRFLSSLLCAVAEPPRICTFHSYFKSFVFSRRPSQSEQILYHVQLQKSGDIPLQARSVWTLSSRLLSSPLHPLGLPARAGARLVDLPSTRISQIRNSILLTCKALETQFRATPVFPGDCLFPGGGGGPIVPIRHPFAASPRLFPQVALCMLAAGRWPPLSGDTCAPPII